jgi:phenylacetate-CoA ligase
MPDLHALAATRFRRTLTAVAAAHPFYRARFPELGLKPDDIRSLDDIQALPLTHKDDYISDPEAFRLRPDDLPADFSAEERVLWDIAYTTGTTSGRPSPFYNTAHDAYAIWDQARRCNAAEGLTPADRVANLYPLAGFPTGAFLSVVRSTMIAGLPVVHGLTGAANSEFKVRNSLVEAVDTVARFRPTVLWGVPSFIRRFLDEACRRNVDLSEVRLVLTSGEPVPAALRATLREQLARLGARTLEIRARYAFTEMQGGLVLPPRSGRARDRAPPRGRRERCARHHAPAPPRYRAAALSRRRYRHAGVHAVPDLRSRGRAGGGDAAAHRQPGEMPRDAGQHRRHS